MTTSHALEAKYEEEAKQVKKEVKKAKEETQETNLEKLHRHLATFATF